MDEINLQTNEQYYDDPQSQNDEAKSQKAMVSFSLSKQLFLLVIGFVLGIIFNKVFFGSYELGFGVLVFQLLYLVGIFIPDYRDLVQKRDFVFFAVISLLLSIWYSFFTNSIFYHLYALIIICIDIFLRLYSKNYIGKTRHAITEMIKFFEWPFVLISRFVESIGEVFTIFLSMLPKTKSTKYSKYYGQILLAIIILISILSVVLPSLMSADMFFKQWILDTGNISGDIVRYFVGNSVFAFVWDNIIVIVLFVAFFAIFNTIQKDHKDDSVQNSIKLNIPHVTILFVLTVLNIIYLIFIFAQFRYLFFGSYDMVVSIGLNSYSEYVHKGFNELIFVSIVNFTIYIFATSTQHIQNTKNTIGHIMVVLIMFFTFMIDFSAIYRARMYMDSYGLTYERFFLIAGILFIMSITLFFIVKVFAPKLSHVRFILLSFLSYACLLGYLNIDSIIANYNIDRYDYIVANGVSSDANFRQSTNLDFDYIFGLSNDAIYQKAYVYNKYLGSDEKEYIASAYFGLNIGYTSVVPETISIFSKSIPVMYRSNYGRYKIVFK